MSATKAVIEFSFGANHYRPGDTVKEDESVMNVLAARGWVTDGGPAIAKPAEVFPAPRSVADAPGAVQKSVE